MTAPAEKKTFETVLSNVTDTYMPLITRQLESNDITFSEYAKQCVISAITVINHMLEEKAISWADPQLDKSNIQETLMQVARLQVNPSVEPRECYFQLRNTPVEVIKKDDKGNIIYDENKKPVKVKIWKKMIEFNIEGAGNDAILSRFGRNIKNVYPHWIVRENDGFEYPKYKGVEYVPPIWEPRGTGDVVRIVYPILHNDNTLHYYIGEREDVRKNLLAHINNNMMNETFGICKDRFKATATELKQINDKKKEIKNRAKSMTLDEILDDAELENFISPAWKEDFSREEMIIRKIRNNIVKKIPKDFGNPIIQESYDMATDTNYKNVIETVRTETATKMIDIVPESSEPHQERKFYPQTGELLDSNTETTETDKTAQNAQNDPVIEGRQKPNFD